MTAIRLGRFIAGLDHDVDVCASIGTGLLLKELAIDPRPGFAVALGNVSLSIDSQFSAFGLHPDSTPLGLTQKAELQTPSATQYSLTVVRSDDGTATMTFYDNGVQVVSATHAGWDDVIPWEPGTYSAVHHADVSSHAAWTLISPTIFHRSGILLHIEGSQLKPNSGSQGCLVADGTFLDAVAQYMSDAGHPGSGMQITVQDASADNYPANLTCSTTEVACDEGSRFGITVTLNGSNGDGATKDLWVRVGLAPGSTAQENDFTFEHANMRKLVSLVDGQEAWYVKIPAGQTSATIIVNVLADNQSELSEVANFHILDYMVPYNTKSHPNSWYADTDFNPQVLILNGGNAIQPVTFNDVPSVDEGLEAHGNSIPYIQHIHVTPGHNYNFDFYAYEIPDSLKIFDNATVYVDTGYVSYDNPGSFTISAKNNGYLTVEVDPNSDPGTLWDLNVNPGSNAPRPLNHHGNGVEGGNDTAAVSANNVDLGTLNPGDDTAVTIAAGDTAEFSATIESGKLYSIAVIASDGTVDPHVHLIGDQSDELDFSDTSTNNNAVGYISTDHDEAVSIQITDDSGAGGQVRVVLTEVTQADLNAFALRLDTPIAAEGKASDTVVADVFRLGDAIGAASVNWRVVGDGDHPVSAADFGGALPSGTINFGDGDIWGEIDFAVSRDHLKEGAEGYKIELYDPTGAVLATIPINGQDSQASGEIIDTFDAVVHEHGTQFDDTLFGGVLDDRLDGRAGDDVLDFSQGGNDRAVGSSGNDQFVFGKSFDKHDRIDGGAGSDTVILSGPYAHGVKPGAATFTSVEGITLLSGHSFKITTVDANVAHGKTLVVDGSALIGTQKLVFDGTHETDGHFVLIGGAGHDVLKGGAGADMLTGGLADRLFGGAGNDTFIVAGAMLDEPDIVKPSTLVNSTMVTAVNLDDSFDIYANPNIADDTAIPHATVQATSSGNMEYYSVTVSEDGATGTFDIDGTNGFDSYIILYDSNGNQLAYSDDNGNDPGSASSRDSNLSYTFAAAGTYYLLVQAYGGGAVPLGDTYTLNVSLDSATTAIAHGKTTISGGAGQDVIKLGATFNALDVIDGGAGTDTVHLSGDYASGITLSAATLVNVEKLSLAAGHSYKLVFDDGNVAAGDTLFVDGAHLHKGQSLISDGSHELDGAFKLHGGNGSDRLIGGAQDDTLAGGGSSDRLTGGLGQDRLVGGKGHDTFIFGSAATSMGTAFDTIVDFVAGTDHIQVKSKITGIDSTISSAVLRTSQFDSDLQAAMQGHLQAHHATLLVAGSGNYAGDTFLVVDQNGTAGYQAGHDLVILMGSSSNVTGLSSGDFTP